MGSFIGHALPGSLFIVSGLWWMFHVTLDYAASLKKDKSRKLMNTGSWRRIPSKRLKNIPFEPLLKLFGPLAGIIGELSPIHFQLLDKNNEFIKPNKFAHSSMYGFFAFSGLIEILNLYKITNFSPETEYVVLALAFAVEGTLFGFHLHGRDMFDVRIHTLLYIVIYLAALVIILEACLPKRRRELFMARTVLVLTQGTWFWEIAYTIYGSKKWFQNAKRDLTEKQLMLDIEVMTVSMMWHLLYWMGLVLFCCIITHVLYKYDKLPAFCRNHGKTEKGSNLLNGKSLTENELSLSEEEEILLKHDSEDNDNMSTGMLRNNIDEAA